MSTTPRLVLFLKSGPNTGKKFAGMPGYYLHDGHWKAVAQHGPAPKGAPQSHHPDAAGTHAAAQHFTPEQWDALKLPESNVNAPTFNKQLAKLKEMSDAGHVTGIVGSSYGSNTYGGKLAKIANHLLGLYGSKHKVSPGQKAGEHEAVQATEATEAHPTGLPDHLAPKAAPEPAPEPHFGPTKDTPVPAGAKMLIDDASIEMLQNVITNNPGNPHIAAYAQEVLAKKKAAAAPSAGIGDVFELDSQYEKMNAGKWKVYNVSPDGQLFYLHKVGAKVVNQTSSATIPAATLSEAIAKGTAKKVELVTSLSQAEIGGLLGWMKAGKPTNKHPDSWSNLWEKLSPAIKNAVVDEFASDAALQPKEGDTKPGANGTTLVLKDGHWVTQGSSGLTSLNATQLGNIQSIPWYKHKLPAENTNAKSHNAAVDKIEAMAHAGDKAGLQTFIVSKGTPKQTYTKKQVLLAQTALAGLSDDSAPAPAPAAKPPVTADTPLNGTQKQAISELSDAEVAALLDAPDLPANVAAHLKAMTTKGPKKPVFTDPFVKVVANKAEQYIGEKYKQGLESIYFENKGSVQIETANLAEYAKKGLLHLGYPEVFFDIDWNGMSLPGKDGLMAAIATGDVDAIKSYKAGNSVGLKAAKATALTALGAPPVARNPVASEQVSSGDWEYNGSDSAMSDTQTMYIEKPDGVVLCVAKTDDGYQLMNLGVDGDIGDDFTDHTSLSEVIAELKETHGVSAPPVSMLQKMDASYKAPAAPAVAPVAPAPVTVTSALFENTMPGHSKFWEVSVSGSSMVTKYGKIGTKGTETKKVFGTPAAAQAAKEKLIKEKTAKGYNSMGWGSSHEHPGANVSTVAPAPKVEPAGPKNGDTKQGAQGTLVFWNGYWHKVLTQAKVDDALFTLPNASTVQLKAAKTAAMLGDIPGFKAAYAATLAAIAGGKKLPKTKKAIEYLAGAMGGDPLKNLTATYSPSADKKAPAAPTAPAQAAPKNVAPMGTDSIDGWKKHAGTQSGYTDGAFYSDEHGQKWYCKFHGAGEEAAKSEVLALKLYEAAGCAVPEMKLIYSGGKFGTASKVVDGLAEDKAGLQSGSRHEIFSGFAADAWLANWDTVGNNPAAGKGWDNIQFSSSKAYRIDAGGALAFKGSGKKKSASEWGNDVVEMKTLLDSSVNANTAKAFKKLTEADLKASAAKVLAVPDWKINALVGQYAGGSDADKKALAAKLIARKNSIAKQYPGVSKKAEPGAKPADSSFLTDTSWVHLAPGEKIIESGTKFGVSFAKIEVPAKGFNAGSIPKAYAYDKSSSKFVNDQNTADIKAIYDLALSGVGPDKVAAITFPEISKSTGEKTGKMLSIEQHPSKAYVQEYLNQVVGELKAQLVPTYRVQNRGSFAASYSEAAAGIASIVKTIDHSKFTKWKDKAADYLVLDRHAGNGIPVPEADAFKEVSETSTELVDLKARSDAAFAKLTATEQNACKAYTGSSYAKWNAAMRLGEVGSAAWEASKPMQKAFDKAAVDLPEGIILHRGLSVGSDTFKAVVGSVIQDGSFQSTSYGAKAAFSGQNTQLRLHLSKGVKGVMATSFSKFGTGEREIILHPNTRYLVLKVDNGAGKTVVDILVLPHEGKK